MRRAVLYLRVSTIDPTTANQERELRQVAERMRVEVSRVYRDHGVSGAKGREERRNSTLSTGALPSPSSTRSWRGRSIDWDARYRT